jgi:hypothetical protein
LSDDEFFEHLARLKHNLVDDDESSDDGGLSAFLGSMLHNNDEASLEPDIFPRVSMNNSVTCTPLSPCI